MIFVLASDFIAYTPTSEDMEWVADYNHDAPVVFSDVSLASDYVSKLASADEPIDDVASGIRKYLNLLAIDAEEAFWNSQKHMVSSELQKVKTNYQLALSAFQRGAVKTSQGYVQNDSIMMIKGIERLEKGIKYMTLADQELNITFVVKDNKPP